MAQRRGQGRRGLRRGRGGRREVRSRSRERRFTSGGVRVRNCLGDASSGGDGVVRCGMSSSADLVGLTVRSVGPESTPCTVPGYSISEDPVAEPAHASCPQ